MSDARIVFNTATNRTVGGGLTDIGIGAVYLDGAEIADNVAGDAGGGIEALQSGALYIHRSRILHNTASLTGPGGAIDASSFQPTGLGVIELTNTQVLNNTADGLWGGGISVWGNDLTISSSRTESNTLPAGGSGAGIFVAGVSAMRRTNCRERYRRVSERRCSLRSRRVCALAKLPR
jgi:hypothetical protein